MILFTNMNVFPGNAARLYTAVLAALFSLCVQGCSQFAPTPEAPEISQPGACRSRHIMRDIQAIGASITGIEARARIQLTVRGIKKPWIKCAFKWCGYAQGDRMRVTGSGPFGITVFDALIRDNLFLLYIPSHDTVYLADIQNDGVGGRDIQSVAAQVRMVLNPWRAADFPDTREVLCAAYPSLSDISSETICYASFEGSGRTLAIFNYLNLSPVALETEGSSVKFSGLARQNGTPLSCVNYPARISINMKSYNLQLDIKVRDVAFNNVPADQPAFDSLPFMTRQIAPLSMLTANIR